MPVRQHMMDIDSSEPPLSYVVAANTDNVNFHVAVGSPAGVVVATLTINSGVSIGDAALNNWALRTGPFAAGSVLTIINNGSIMGHGGEGSGGDGGAAILFERDCTIDNTNGYIFGGGGGGQSGLTGTYSVFFITGGGGGGGGGQGNPGGPGSAGDHGADYPGSDGTDGTISAPGDGGAGGSSGTGAYGGDGGGGGSWGQGGHNSSVNNNGLRSGSPGAAGSAIRLNGHSVTWTGGNNSTQVKGAVA